MKIIKEVSKQELQDFLYNLPLEDEHVYKEVNESDTLGIFQMNGKTAQGMVELIQPSNFEELTAVNAFARPGTSDFAPQYVKNRDENKSHYPEAVSNVLSETNSIILYQEQLMEVFHKIGGFSLAETNDIRGLMKKLGKAEKKEEDVKEWEEIVKQFKVGVQEKGITKSEADFIANDLIKMSSYSFNRCISGDSYIFRDNKARWYPTVEEMYLTLNDPIWAKNNGHKSLQVKYKREGYGKTISLNKENRLVLNNIKNIYFNGKKEVYEIITESGKKIKVTSNHKIPVLENNEIIFKTLDNGLKEKDIILTKGKYKKTKYNYSFSEFTNETRPFKDYSNHAGFLSGEENAGCIKGYPVIFEKIVKIEAKGFENVYDIEMEHPYHTFVANDIVVHNSHATAYSYIAAMTLYLSVYFRKYFYSSVLSYEVDRGEYLLDRLKAVKKRGFEIVKPNINESKMHVSPLNERKIVFGLADIKYIGEKPAKIILENQPYSSLIDFIIKTRSRAVSSRVIKALISIGAFDEIEEYGRKKLLYIFDMFWERKKSIKVAEKLELIYKEILKEVDNLPGLSTSMTDLRNYEKEYLGFNFFSTVFTGNFLEGLYKLQKKGLVELSMEDLTSAAIKVPVLINSIRTLKDKNKNEMAFISIEDYTGEEKSVPVFASYWEHIGKELVNGKVHFLNLYKNDDNQVMFGTRKYVRNPAIIKRMVKRVEDI